MKVAVPEAIDHPGVPLDITLAGRVPEAVEHGFYAPNMAGRNHGSRTLDRRVHHSVRSAELHSGAIRRRSHQHRSSVIYETVGKPERQR